MFTLTTDKHNNYDVEFEFVGASLEAIRDQIVREYDERANTMHPDWEDQWLAVFPLDDDFEDDEVVPAPREVTESLLIDMACQLLGTTEKHLHLVEDAKVYTSTEVADKVAAENDCTTQAAAVAVTTLIGIFNERDQLNLDPARLSAEHAALLSAAAAGVIDESRQDGDLTGRIEVACKQVERLEGELQAAREHRDHLIRMAAHEGVGATQLAKLTGMNRSMVYKILG